MKIRKGPAACALSALLLLPLSGCGIMKEREKPVYTVTYTSDDESIAADTVVGMETIDDALLERGYSELFIEWTGDETKRMLYDAGAAFQTGSGVTRGIFTPDDGRWADTYGMLVISHVPTDDEGVIRKIVTLSWLWASDQPVEEDYVLVNYDSGGGFSVYPEYTMFELHGEGVLYESEACGAVSVPQKTQGTFCVKRGSDALTTIDVGHGYAAYYFSVDPSCAFRRIYHHAVGAVTQGDQYADFHIQSDWHMGSYSLGLICALAPDDDSYGIQGITVQYRHNSEIYDWVDAGAWGVCNFDYSPDNRYVEEYEQYQ